MVTRNARLIATPLSPRSLHPVEPDTTASASPSHRLRIPAVAVTSVLLTVPCFWQRSLEAGDLSSHIYNTWLAQLIERGQAPGLALANQSNNVLFDLILGTLARFFSLDLAARLGAALAVLVFFWGTFAFVTSLAKQPPWFLSPLIGVFAYGWTFNFGFFNYYLSIGLACFALAALSEVKGWTRLVVFVFLPLIWLAHPLGLVWFVAAATYLEISNVVPHLFHVLLVLGSIASIVLIRIYLLRHYAMDLPAHSALFYSGLDQLLFTNRYEALAALFATFLAASVALQFGRSRRDFSAFLKAAAISLGLYVILEAAVQFLPDAVRLPQYAAPLSDLTERLTLISAVLLCGIFAVISPRIWHWVASGTIALTFFFFLYQDTARLNRTHAEVTTLVHSLPAGERVILRVAQPLKYRFSFKHVIDEACIGHCFSYANYEPASRQFRVRSSPANPIVLSDVHDVSAVEGGTYIVRPRDLPLYEIYQCGATWDDLCIRSLSAGPLP